MFKVKSKMYVLLVISLFMVVLSACGDGNENGTSDVNGESSEEGITLTMLLSDTADNPGLRAVIASIEEELNIKTKIELRPGGPEGINVVKTRLATGGMPDLISYNSGSNLMALNPEKHFVDLAEEPFMEKVFDSYKEVVSDEGKLFGIPAQSSQVGAWFYNKKVYEELDLSIPKTWDELEMNNEKIQAAGKTAVIGTYGELWTSQLPLLADFYNVQAEMPSFAEEYTAGNAKYATTSAALRGFERIEDIGKKGYMNDDYTVATYEQGMQMLAEGTGAHYPMLTQILPLIADKYPDKVDDIGVFPQPSDTNDVHGLTVWMPDTIVISNETEHEEAAKQWLEYFISEKGIEIFEEEYKSVGPYVIEGIELPEDSYEAVKDMVPYFDSGNVAPALEFVSPIKGPNLAQLCTAVGSGSMTALEAAKSYDQDVEKQAKQLGLEW